MFGSLHYVVVKWHPSIDMMWSQIAAAAQGLLERGIANHKVLVESGRLILSYVDLEI
jgi:hypothetical protein